MRKILKNAPFIISQCDFGRISAHFGLGIPAGSSWGTEKANTADGGCEVVQKNCFLFLTLEIRGSKQNALRSLLSVGAPCEIIDISGENALHIAAQVCVAC